MPLSLMQAGQIVKNNLPYCVIANYVEHNGKYIFEAYQASPGETGFAPFFSVDRETGEFMDIVIHRDTEEDAEIRRLFLEAKEMSETEL